MTKVTIKSIAEKYIGKTEIKGNMGFNDKDFEKKMIAIGFRPSYQWCALFTELVWAEFFSDSEVMSKAVKKNFSASTRTTYNNFKRVGMVEDKPVVGSVVIWQLFRKGVGSWSGHAGIVTEVHDDYFVSIEGNTNDSGGREGYIVAKKSRKYSTEVYSGLAVLGFVNPNKTPLEAFKTKAEGNKFRAWVNSEHPDYANEIDLDVKGSHTNVYIMKAFDKYGKEYEESK